ncbi:MAG: hypothetical protein N3B21_01785 [Clostridia bacterium]|nr:hypothetical protein [Clostridia bacterium]
MKILLYPQLYSQKGTGNIARMYYLYKYLQQSEEFTEVVFKSNDADLAEKIIYSIGGRVKLDSGSLNSTYDVIVYDSPEVDSKLLPILKKQTGRLIALDFFEYTNEYVNDIINLFNHNREEIGSFRGRIFEGADYAILKDEVTGARKPIDISNEKVKVVITFGGEDPNSNTLKVLSYIDFNSAYVKVVIGHLNKDREKIIESYSDKAKVLEPTFEIGELISTNDIVICGGGTTLLESIYLGNPIIAVPQNKNESGFINHIKSRIPLFEAEDIPMLMKCYKDREFRERIRGCYTNYVDGRGMERIKRIILEG